MYSFFFPSVFVKVGHKAAQCGKIPSESKDIYRTPDVITSQGQKDRNNLRPLDEVTCYRVIHWTVSSFFEWEYLWGKGERERRILSEKSAFKFPFIAILIP